jgi:CheY-like chemotaxis protein
MKKKVMVIDDDEGMLITVKKMLVPEGFDVITAVSAEECLRKLRDKKPDCFLIDIMMPEMDGWMLLKHIKKDARLRDIPVLIITAKPASPQIFEEKEKLGYADYIMKPFTKIELLEVLREVGME